jgi:hypothetical protein
MTLTASIWDTANRQTGEAVSADEADITAGTNRIPAWPKTYNAAGKELRSADGGGHFTVNTYSG